MTYQNALFIFGINKVSDLKKLSRVYKHLAKKCHPDLGGSTAAFQKLNQAYFILKTPVQQELKKEKNNNEIKKENFLYEESKKIQQNFSFIQFIAFSMLAILLRYKIIKINNELYLKTNKGKYIYVASKEKNKNNNYFKIHDKFQKIDPKTKGFQKVSELVFVLFL